MTAFDFLRWVLSDFWRFAGCAMLLLIALSGLAAIIRGFRGLP